MIWQRKNIKFTVAGNHEYKEIDSMSSVHSSLKSHPLWVTLQLYLLFFKQRDKEDKGYGFFSFTKSKMENFQVSLENSGGQLKLEMGYVHCSIFENQDYICLIVDILNMNEISFYQVSWTLSNKWEGSTFSRYTG